MNGGGEWKLHNGFLNCFGAFTLSDLTRVCEPKTNTSNSYHSLCNWLV